MNPLLESLPAGLFLVDRQGNLTDLNAALADALGLDAADVLGEPYHEFFSQVIARAAEPEVAYQALHRAVERVELRPTVELELGGEDGRILEMVLFTVRDSAGAPAGWGGLVRDVTEARDRLAWKLDLLSMLAHDLRTPLASLKGHATALLANYRRWGDDLVLEFLAAMDRGADDLVRQVDRSLALTRVEAGRLGLRPEAAAPADLAGQALERAAASLAESNVAVDLPDDLPQVRVDPGRMEEVLVNLLDNAARHSPSGEPIRISAQVEGPMVRFSVIDSGPGIPPGRQEEIFEKYGRGGSSQGAGLGLFISRRIVESHGGRIWVESPPEGGERGAAFHFTVPLMPSPPTARRARRPPAVEAGGEGQRVLVVEDDPDMQSLVRTIFTEQGFEVETAPDGPTALDIIQTSSPDLLILDLSLPRLDGLSVCRSIRRWSNLPILVITSRTSQADLVAALDAGADDYVVKPFQSLELLARARALLRRKDQWRAPDTAQTLRADGVLIDYASRQVWARGELVPLTPTEFDLLAYLSSHRGQVLTHRQLIDHVWEPKEGSRHRLFVHISRLRKKLERDPDDPTLIVTRWGVGYVFLPR